jgi:phosphotransferase system  glucose/maltose/N-acetylglucosamine-specific IIC component
MFTDERKIRGLSALRRRFLRARSAIAGHFREQASNFARVRADPFLPLILIGVVAAAYAFAFILKPPAEVVLGVLGIGCVTAFLETSRRN